MDSPERVPEYLMPKLTPEQCTACQRALRTLVDMVPLYALAEKCGVDCTGHRATAERLRQPLEAIREFLIPE